MEKLTANDVREMWAYRENWLGVVTATDSATPLDVVGWAFSHVSSDDPADAMAFFEKANRTGIIDRMFSKVVTPQWKEGVRLTFVTLGKLAPKLREEVVFPYFEFMVHQHH